MNENKFLLISMEDPKSKKLSEILGNSTCKKIVDLLAEVKELSEKDISIKLNLPLNTVEYNLKKLIEVGIVEKTKSFFWSVKGKKIPTYQLSNKFIVISSKNSSFNFKSLLPVALLVGAGAFLIKVFYPIFSVSKEIFQDNFQSAEFVKTAVFEASSEIVENSNNFVLSGNLVAGFFLLGAALSIILFIVFGGKRK